jgi:hypothetical protein
MLSQLMVDTLALFLCWASSQQQLKRCRTGTRIHQPPVCQCKCSPAGAVSWKAEVAHTHARTSHEGRTGGPLVGGKICSVTGGAEQMCTSVIDIHMQSTTAPVIVSTWLNTLPSYGFHSQRVFPRALELWLTLLSQHTP